MGGACAWPVPSHPGRPAPGAYRAPRDVKAMFLPGAGGRVSLGFWLSGAVIE